MKKQGRWIPAAPIPGAGHHPPCPSFRRCYRWPAPSPLTKGGFTLIKVPVSFIFIIILLFKLFFLWLSIYPLRVLPMEVSASWWEQGERLARAKQHWTTMIWVHPAIEGFWRRSASANVSDVEKPPKSLPKIYPSSHAMLCLA